MNVLFVSGMDGDTRRYRCIHHQEQLALAGVESSLLVDDDLEIYAAAATCDVAILHRVPWSDLIADLVTLMHQRNKPVLFETDDLVFELGLHDRIGLLDMLDPAEAQRLRASLAGQAETFRRADFALVTTEYLAQAAEKAGVPARVHRNACSAEMLAIAEQAYATRFERRHDQGTVIAAYFSGTGSHNRDFASITPSLLEAMAAYPQLHLHLSGHLQIDPAFDAFADRIRRALCLLARTALPHRPGRHQPGPARTGQSILPGQERDQIYRSRLSRRADGRLRHRRLSLRHHARRDRPAGGKPGRLTAALARLIDDPDARHALGDRARAETLQRYSPQERSAQLIALLEDVLDGFSSPDAAAQCRRRWPAVLLRRLRALEEKRAARSAACPAAPDPCRLGAE